MRTLLATLILLIATQAIASDNIVILLDTSGSMDERMKTVKVSRMQAAQQALGSVVDQIPADTNVGLLTFNGWAYPLGPVNKQNLKAAIAKTVPEGGTPLGVYSKAAADALLTARAKSVYGTYRLIVVTDGEASDSGELEKNLPEILRRGIILDSIGVDMKKDHTLSKKSRNYMRADDPTSLTSALKSVLAEVGSKTTDISGDFEMLKAIPDKTAEAVIEALTTHQNHPIGEKPPPPATNSSSSVDQTNLPVASSGIGWKIPLLMGIGVFVAVVGYFVVMMFQPS